MDIRIRPVEIRDAVDIGRLDAQMMALNATADPDHYRMVPDVDGAQKLAFWADNAMKAWVAEVEGRVVGYISAELRYAGMNDVDTRATAREWCLDTMVVDEPLRDQGVGTALMLYAEEEGRRAHADVSAMTVIAFNENARRLYENLGYTITSYRMKKDVKPLKPIA